MKTYEWYITGTSFYKKNSLKLLKIINKEAKLKLKIEKGNSWWGRMWPCYLLTGEEWNLIKFKSLFSTASLEMAKFIVDEDLNSKSRDSEIEPFFEKLKNVYKTCF